MAVGATTANTSTERAVPLTTTQPKEAGERVVPDCTSPAKKLWKWLIKHGKNNLDLDTVEKWYNEEVKPNGGKITVGAARNLLGKNLGFFKIFFNPSLKDYVVKPTDTGWDNFIGNGDGKADDAVDVDTLIDKLDETAFMGEAQGKDVWGMLESKRVVPVLREVVGKGVKNYLNELIEERIKNSGLPEETQTKLRNAAAGYIDKGEIEKLVGNNKDIDDGKEKKPYNYLGYSRESNESHFYEYLITSYNREMRGKHERHGGTGEALTEEEVNTMYTLTVLNSYYNSEYSIRAVYDTQKGIFSTGANNLFADIINPESNLKASINKRSKHLQKGKVPSEQTVINQKRDKELLKLEEELSMEERAVRFVCRFAHTGGHEWQQSLEGFGYRLKDPEKAKAMSLKDCLHLFRDPRKMAEKLEKAPSPLRVTPAGTPPAPVQAGTGISMNNKFTVDIGKTKEAQGFRKAVEDGNFSLASLNYRDLVRAEVKKLHDQRKENFAVKDLAKKPLIKMISSEGWNASEIASLLKEMANLRENDGNKSPQNAKTAGTVLYALSIANPDKSINVSDELKKVDAQTAKEIEDGYTALMTTDNFQLQHKSASGSGKGEPESIFKRKSPEKLTT